MNKLTGISDIEDIECEDGKTRRHIDTPDKLISIIRSEFKKLSYKRKEFHKAISLSTLKINIDYESGLPSLCDILDKLDSIEKLDLFEKSDFEGTTSYVIKKRITYLDCEIWTGSFKNITFFEDVSFHNSYFMRYASFYKCQFNKKITFANVTFEKGLDFEKNIFNDDVNLSHSKIKGYKIYFCKCTFHGEFRAQGLKLSMHDQNTTPYIDFRNSVFHKDVDLSYIDFDRDCYFANTKILGDISFRKSHFRVSVDFYAMKLEGNMLFSSYPKEENEEEITPNIINHILFKRAKVNGRIDFEKCEIELLEASFADIQKGALFRIYKSKIKRLDFTSIYNDGAIMLEDNQDNIDEITFKSALNTGLIEIENTKAKYIKDRKTARLLKDSAFKSGNNIDGLNYKAKEMALYQKELTSGNYLREISRSIFLTIIAVWIIYNTHQFYIVSFSYVILLAFTWTSVSKWFTNRSIFKSLMSLFKAYPVGEFFLLNLNTISNKNGLSWSRGMLFTFLAWILFYGLFIMSRDGIGNEFFLSIEANREGFINYLWLPSGLKDLFNDNKTTSWLTSSIFILGKIAITYGIYQTITAFRKYKH